MLQPKTIHAEEVAAITGIPDAYLEDSAVNLWGWVRPRLAEAIAVAIDDAVLFGIGAPATFPVGGVIAVAYCNPVPAVGLDAVDGVNQAMAMVEAQGIAVTGHAADLVTKSVLRGVRDAERRPAAGHRPGGHPAGAHAVRRPDRLRAVVERGQRLHHGRLAEPVVGVRSSIRYNLDPSGVVTNAQGNVVLSGFESNTTPLKVWARIGAVIINPVTVKTPAGGKPFSRARLATIAPAPPFEDAGDDAPARSTAKK